MSLKPLNFDLGNDVDPLRELAQQFATREVKTPLAPFSIPRKKVTWMAGQAIRTPGGNGYINQYPTGRLWRDAKLYEIGAGTSEIRRMLIGRELFNETT